MFDFFLTRNSTKIEEVKLTKSVGRMTCLAEENKILKRNANQAKDENNKLVEERTRTNASMLELVETRRILMEKEVEVDELVTRLNTMHSKLNAVQDDLKLEKDKTAQLNKEIEYLCITKKMLENMARKGENSEGGEAEWGGVKFLSCSHINSAKVSIRAVVESDKMYSSEDESDHAISDAVMTIIKLLDQENQREKQRKMKKRHRMKK